MWFVVGEDNKYTIVIEKKRDVHWHGFKASTKVDHFVDTIWSHIKYIKPHRVYKVVNVGRILK